MGLNRDQRDILRDAPGWSLVWIVGGAAAIAAVIALAYMWTYSVGWFSADTAEVRGQTAQREQTQANGAFRAGAEQDFHARCGAVVALDGQIQLTERNLAADKGPGGDPSQLYVDQQALRGQQAQRLDLAQQYNARADSVGTTGPFRDAGLPATIGTETPTCG